MAITRKAIPHVCSAGFRLLLIIGVISITLACCGLSLAQNLTVLHVFNGGPGDGYNPFSPVVIDQNGVLYGTTFYGGNDKDCVVGCGEVYKVVPPSQQGDPWTYSAIYEFTGNNWDGCCVYSALTLDSQGRLYGVNSNLFQLTPTAHSFWKYKNVYDIEDGVDPSTPLLMDSAGAFYGVTSHGGLQNCGGGQYFCGEVLQYVPTVKGLWTQNVLYQFTGGAD